MLLELPDIEPEELELPEFELELDSQLELGSELDASHADRFDKSVIPQNVLELYSDGTHMVDKLLQSENWSR